MITSLKQLAKCIRCGGRLSAPDKCTYVDEEFVCYHWTCPKCGCDFDVSTSLYQDAPIKPEIVEEFLPNLLVAPFAYPAVTFLAKPLVAQIVRPTV